jgi:hypothetical protein
MGLLDDAIREHLELKRRRGADPTEIAREETEALGPVRRDAPDEDTPEAPEVEVDAPEPTYDAGPYADHVDHEPAHEPAGLDEPGAAYADAPPAEVELDPYEPPTTHDAPFAEREDESATPPHGDPLAYQATREFSATELADALDHPEPAAPAAPEPPAPPAEPPAPAPSAADALPADDADADPDAEDELEDTPDFLQETPEHDRLWFEQKPPKDFDF